MGREVMRMAPKAEDQSDASTSQGMLEAASSMMKLGGASHRSQLCLVTYFKGLTFESSFGFQEKPQKNVQLSQTPLFLQTHSLSHQRQSSRPLEGLLLQWMDPSGTHSFHKPETSS